MANMAPITSPKKKCPRIKSSLELDCPTTRPLVVTSSKAEVVDEGSLHHQAHLISPNVTHSCESRRRRSGGGEATHIGETSMVDHCDIDLYSLRISCPRHYPRFNVFNNSNKWRLGIVILILVALLLPIPPAFGKPLSNSNSKGPPGGGKSHHHHQHHRGIKDKALAQRIRSSAAEYEAEMERLRKVEENIQQSLESVASLSIVRSLDILRHSWLLEVNKNKMRNAQNKKAAENKAILDSIG